MPIILYFASQAISAHCTAFFSFSMTVMTAVMTVYNTTIDSLYKDYF